MTEIPIIWKILILLILLLVSVISTFLGWRVLDLRKRVKQLQKDRDKALEDWYRLLRTKPMLDELEKKMILNALKMPGYKAAIDEPSTHHHVRKAYRELKEKIKESLSE